MAKTINHVMTTNLVTLSQERSVEEAARRMKENDIGSVLLTDDDGRLTGILTDRDIAVRAVAEGKPCSDTPAREIFSGEPLTLAPDDEVATAVELMRQKSVRRLPVVDRSKPIGMVSLGDLAEERDPKSALGAISAAPPTT